jgi:hypothetical protein
MPVFNLAKRRKRAIDALNSTLAPHERLRPSDVDGASDEDLAGLSERKSVRTAVVGRAETFTEKERGWNPYEPGVHTTPAPQYGNRWETPMQTGSNNTNRDSDSEKTPIFTEPDPAKLEEAKYLAGEKKYLVVVKTKDGQKPSAKGLPDGEWQSNESEMYVVVNSYEDAIEMQGRLKPDKRRGSMVRPAN